MNWIPWMRIGILVGWWRISTTVFLHNELETLEAILNYGKSASCAQHFQHWSAWMILNSAGNLFPVLPRDVLVVVFFHAKHLFSIEKWAFPTDPLMQLASSYHQANCKADLQCIIKVIIKLIVGCQKPFPAPSASWGLCVLAELRNRVPVHLLI